MIDFGKKQCKTFEEAVELAESERLLERKKNTHM
jgi:hypothetical protein